MHPRGHPPKFMPRKGRGKLCARARRGGKFQKAGTQNVKKAMDRRAREADGSSRYLPLSMRPEDNPQPDSDPDPEEDERYARRREQWRLRKQRQREREKEVREAAYQEREELVAIAEGTKKDPLPIKPESIARQHCRDAQKLRALIVSLAEKHGAKNVQEAFKILQKDDVRVQALAGAEFKVSRRCARGRRERVR